MKIRTQFYLLLAFLVSYLPLSAQKKINIPEKLDNTLLWQIKGKGIKKDCYLYGTIHLIEESYYFMSPTVEDKFKKTKALFTEIDMSNMLDMGMKMMQLAPMKGTTLKELLSEEEYNIVKNYFEKESKSPETKAMPFSMYENWQPILLQSFLYQDMIGNAKTKSYEMEFVGMANRQNKSFGGLESIEDQVKALSSVSYETQAKGLVKSIKDLKENPEEAGKSFREMMESYKSQDIDKMVEMTKDDEQIGEGEEALLINRNKNWIPLIIKQSKKQPTFFAVGAAHLGGPNGVIRLLMQEGYTLIPIDIN